MSPEPSPASFENLLEEIGDLIRVGNIFNALLDIFDHLGDLYVRAAVLRSFERADARGDSRICVGAARSQHAGGESRVVSAAVLGVEHEADIEHMRLFRSEFLSALIE